MYKKIIWSSILVLVVIISLFVVTVYSDLNSPTSNESEDSKDKEVEGLIMNNDESELQKKEENYTNPFNQEYKPEELTDEHYRDYIHKMSHQKIEADDRRGFYKITDERIEWLLKSLEITKGSLDNGDLYEDILKRWRDGDFSIVDKDHNAVWELQGGTTGKATGIQSEEMEKKMIENAEESK